MSFSYYVDTNRVEFIVRHGAEYNYNDVFLRVDDEVAAEMMHLKRFSGIAQARKWVKKQLSEHVDILTERMEWVEGVRDEHAFHDKIRDRSQL